MNEVNEHDECIMYEKNGPKGWWVQVWLNRFGSPDEPGLILFLFKSSFIRCKEVNNMLTGWAFAHPVNYFAPGILPTQ